MNATVAVITTLIYAGQCISPRDTRVSNDSLYVTVVFDVVSDFAGKSAAYR